MKRTVEELLHSYRAVLKVSEDALESMYQEHFGQLFLEARELFVRMKSETCPVTDQELEWILTVLPIQLFEASEKINCLRLDLEVIKLKIKELRYDLKCNSDLPAAKAQERVSAETIDDEIVCNIFSCLLTRAENEVSFSRELIMGAKKVWDSRRRAEESMPVSPPKDESDTLPEYDISTTRGSTYIK